MATFPTGTYAPASKSNGQTIQAAFFNDPEAEIIAIENELRTGLTNVVTVAPGINQTASTGSNNFAGASTFARLQVTGGSTLASLVVSGGSTLASLVVAGGSTLATLQVTGASTFTGAVTFAAPVTFGGGFAVPSVSLQLTADVQVAAAANFCPSWGVQDWSVGGMHSTVTNSSRITFADSTGLYAVGVCLEYNNLGAAEGRIVRIRYNDTSAVVGQTALGDETAHNGIQVSGVVRAASTADYVTVIYTHTGSTSRLFANSTEFGTRFWAYKISA